jgi:hypothetical protein
MLLLVLDHLLSRICTTDLQQKAANATFGRVCFLQQVAAGADSLTQTIAQPTKNIGQPNEVQGTLQCSGNAQAGSAVS